MSPLDITRLSLTVSIWPRYAFNQSQQSCTLPQIQLDVDTKRNHSNNEGIER